MQKEDLPLRVISRINNDPSSSNGLLENYEIAAIQHALVKYNGHREKTAKALGISRRTLQYKLNQFGLGNV